MDLFVNPFSYNRCGRHVATIKKTGFNQAKHDLGVRKSRNADRYLHFGITVDGSGMLQHSKKRGKTWLNMHLEVDQI